MAIMDDTVVLMDDITVLMGGPVTPEIPVATIEVSR